MKPGSLAKEAKQVTPPRPVAEPAQPGPEAAAQPEGWDELISYLDDALREYVATGSDSALTVPGAVSVVNREQVLARGATNVTEAMRGLPGVDVTMITASQPLVGLRGSNPFDTQRLALLVDGTPMSLDFFGVKTFTQLPLAMVDIERIEVLRNPSVLYGAGAIAGAINIVTRRPTTNELNAKLSLGEQVFRHASASAAGMVDQGFYRVSFDVMRTNQFADRQTIEGNGPNLIDFPAGIERSKILIDQHYTASGRFNRRFGAHVFDASATFSEFDGFLRFPDRICEQDVDQRNIVASLGHEVDFGDVIAGRQYSIRTRATFTQMRSDLAGARDIARTGTLPNGTVVPSASPHSLTREEWMGTSEVSGPFLESLSGQFVAGVELKHHRTHDVLMLAQDYGLFTGGIYALPSISPVEKLRLFFGGRADLGISQQLHFSPTLSAVYQVMDHGSVRASLSSAARSPNIYELGLYLPFVEDVSRGKRGYYFGNPDLQDERLSQAELGYLWQSDQLKAGTNVFFSHLDRQIEMVEISPARAADRGFLTDVQDLYGAGYDATLPYLEYHNQANVTTVGAEVFGEFNPLPDLILMGSYTHLTSWAEVTTDRADVVRETSAADRNAPRNKFSVGARHTFRLAGWPKLNVSAHYDWTDTTSAYVSGALKTIPAWSVLTARVGIGLPQDIGELAVEGFNVLDSAHFEWPRHQVGRRVLGTLTLKL